MGSNPAYVGPAAFPHWLNPFAAAVCAEVIFGFVPVDVAMAINPRAAEISFVMDP